MRTKHMREASAPFFPSPGTPGEGQGGGFLMKSNTFKQPPPQPSPGVPEEGVKRSFPRPSLCAMFGMLLVLASSNSLLQAKSAPTTRPYTKQQIDEAIKKGVEFLVKNQE